MSMFDEITAARDGVRAKNNYDYDPDPIQGVEAGWVEQNQSITNCDWQEFFSQSFFRLHNVLVFQKKMNV